MFFDDYVGAVKSYPGDYVLLEIVEVDVPNGSLNANEQGSFRVQVTNTGPLNLTDVTVRVRGLNGATVANNGAAAPFVDEIVTGVLPTIYGYSDPMLTTGSPLKFTAPAAAQASMDLVKATLEDWNCNTDHIHNVNSNPRPNGPNGTYATEVFPA